MPHVLQNLLGFLWDFLVVGIMLKIVVAHWLGGQLSTWADKALHKTEKRTTILTHFMSQVGREGHGGSIAYCHDGKCAELR